MQRGESLVRFLPSRLIAQLGQTNDTPSESWLEGACLFADIVGFTQLTERYAHSGATGLEELGSLLNASFAHYVSEVQRSGGEVVDFAGDALLAYWPATSGGVQLAARAAVECAAAMTRPVQGDELPALHVGVGSGKLWAARVGALGREQHVVLGGPAVRAALAAEKLSERGEVLLSVETASHLSDVQLGPRGEARVLLAPPSRVLRPVPELPRLAPDLWPMGQIPRVVQERWTGRTGSWRSELRRITPVFVGVPGIDDQRPDALASLQRVVSAIQDVVASFSLESGRVMLDDKGLVFMLVFGVPYDTYADDGPRAVRVALAIERKLAALGHAVSAGVSAGAAFCGVLGTEQRSGYWTIGPPMNRAARLMGAADHGLFVEDVLEGIGDAADLDLATAAPLSLKGLSQLQPLRVRARAASETVAKSLHGREREQERIATLLAQLRDGVGGVLTVSGEAGLGKSALIEDLLEKARRLGLRSAVGRNDPQTGQSFGVWREILLHYLQPPPELSREALSGWLKDRLRRTGSSEHWAVLCTLLGLEIESEHKPAAGGARADATLEALTELLRELAPASSVIVLEDVHWMDSASFRLAARVAQLLPGVLLVLTSRSAESGALGQVQLAAAHNAHAIELQPLDGQAALALAGQLLGGRAASAELQRHIREHSQGNPLYIVEYLLLEEHAADGAAPGASAQSMRSLITSHLDRLRPEEARAVRIASVLGTSFNWAQLQLLAEREPNGHETLQPWGLVRQRILTQQEGSERGFRFAHALLRDVAYELMLVQERKALHHDAARLLEGLAEPTAASTLAHHWHLAGNAQRTQLWSDRAGSEALELGAFEEAAGHFERCLQLADPHAEPRALTWHRKLGDAYAGLGALKTRAEHARVGLKLAGESVGPARSTSMARAGRDFLLHSLNLGGRPHTDSNIEVAALYRHLAHVAYFESDGPGLFVLTLRAVRAAENEATSAILCGALAELGGALGLGGMHPLGMRYLQRAVDTAQGLTHPHGLAYVHMVRALYLLGRGEWEQSQHSSEVCQDICERISDPVNWGNAQIIRFWSSYYRGDSAASESLAAGLFSRARRTGNRQHEVWALRALGLVRLRAGAPATARPQLESALSFAHIEDINEYMPTLAALALCHQRLGETERARELCEQALQLARKLGRPTGHAVLPGLAALVELALALFDPARQGGAQGGAEVRAALARLDDYRRVFPIGVPTHHSCRAAVFERRGNGTAARRERERAARAAQDLGMTAVMAFDATLPA